MVNEIPVNEVELYKVNCGWISGPTMRLIADGSSLDGLHPIMRPSPDNDYSHFCVAPLIIADLVLPGYVRF